MQTLFIATLLSNKHWDLPVQCITIKDGGENTAILTCISNHIIIYLLHVIYEQYLLVGKCVEQIGYDTSIPVGTIHVLA